MKIGDRVYGYELIGQIPGGGMAEVWKARHHGGNIYALKFLKEENRGNPELKKRLQREHDIQCRRLHPNIVEAISDFPSPPGLAMVFVPGRDLAQLIRDDRSSLTPDRIISISRDVLGALGAAHEAGIYHRDVKPSNILIEECTGRALLTDFGIAAVEGGEGLTQGAPWGSPAYMSPEQTRGLKVDGRTDIYSFGCVLYEMLTGVTPFHGSTDLALAHQNDHAQVPSRRVAGAPRAFNEVVMACLNKDPEARPESCAALAARLASLGGQPQPPQPPDTPPIRRPDPPQPPQPPDTPPTWRLDPPKPPPPRPWIKIALLVILFLVTSGYLWSMSQPIRIRMFGSSSVGDELGPGLAKAYLNSPKIGGSNAVCKDVKLPYKGQSVDMKECTAEYPIYQRFYRRPRTVEIYSHETAIAFECLAARTCDIGMASRRMTMGDRQNNAGLEDLFARTSEHVIGLDGVAIVLPMGVLPPNMTIDDARRVFCQVAWPISSWSEFPGLYGPIIRVIRNEGSGTRDFFDQRVCGGSKKNPKLVRLSASYELKSSELVAKVKEVRGSVGFVSSSLAAGVAAVALAANPGAPYWEPTAENIKLERYPLTRRLYLYNNSETLAAARDLIELASSEAGQDAAKANHFVPLTAEAGEIRISPYEPADLRELASGARELDLSFRFESGRSSPTLDSFARDNIDRVKDYALKHPKSQFIVLGFTDNQPSRRAGMDDSTLSQQRADAVAEEMRSRAGIEPILVKGYGAHMPVNPANTPEARQENRRAVVWVR